MFSQLIRRVGQFILGQPVVFWACMIANLLGAVIGGVVWYGPQLAAAPVWAYLFIPDCPLAALVATIALIAIRSGKRWNGFYALVAFGCIKYGLWTLAFWMRHWVTGGEIEPISVGLFITHMGLVAEGLIIAGFAFPLSMPKRLAVIGWYLLSIAIDYGLGFHPPLTPFVPVDYVLVIALGLTLLLGTTLLVEPQTRAMHTAKPLNR